MSSIKPPQPGAMEAVTCAMAMQAGLPSASRSG